MVHLLLATVLYLLGKLKPCCRFPLVFYEANRFLLKNNPINARKEEEKMLVINLNRRLWLIISIMQRMNWKQFAVQIFLGGVSANIWFYICLCRQRQADLAQGLKAVQRRTPEKNNSSLPVYSLVLFVSFRNQQSSLTVVSSQRQWQNSIGSPRTHWSSPDNLREAICSS